jgi:hypothetical protein
MARSAGNRDSSPLGVSAISLGIFREFVRLVSTEFLLLRAELGEKIGVIGLGLGLTVGGGV